MRLLQLVGLSLKSTRAGCLAPDRMSEFRLVLPLTFALRISSINWQWPLVLMMAIRLIVLVVSLTAADVTGCGDALTSHHHRLWNLSETACGMDLLFPCIPNQYLIHIWVFITRQLWLQLSVQQPQDQYSWPPTVVYKSLGGLASVLGHARWWWTLLAPSAIAVPSGG